LTAQPIDGRQHAWTIRLDRIDMAFELTKRTVERSRAPAVE
jgi:hypothetical protein